MMSSRVDRPVSLSVTADISDPRPGPSRFKIRLLLKTLTSQCSSSRFTHSSHHINVLEQSHRHKTVRSFLSDTCGGEAEEVSAS